MSDLWDCFSNIIKEENIKFCKNGGFILKGGTRENKYNTTVLAKNGDNLVVFDVGKNSHASFVKSGYNLNCDYIFIQINSDNISFILCELKKSDNINRCRAFKQLKCSIPLAHYLKQLLITHCGQGLERLKINCKKILLIKDIPQITTIRKKPEIDNEVHIFYGEEFSSTEILNS